jgi:Domain of unknown function (DUF4093)
VEHTPPQFLRLALAAARPSQPQRTEFSRDDLVRMGLVTDMASPERGCNDAPARRRDMCMALGIGECDGKQLLKQLNMYGFERADVEKAMSLVSRLRNERK